MESLQLSRNFFQVLFFMAVDTHRYIHIKFVHVNTEISLVENVFSEGRGYRQESRMVENPSTTELSFPTLNKS